MFFYFNFLNSNESLFYTLIKVRLNYTFGSHFRNKISIWSFYLFFYLNLVPMLGSLMQSSPFREWCNNGVTIIPDVISFPYSQFGPNILIFVSI